MVCRCFQVFKVIHQLVDTEEDILMVRTDFCFIFYLHSSSLGSVNDAKPFHCPRPTGGHRRHQGVCRRWREIPGVEEHPAGGEEHRQGCQLGQ